MLQDKFYVLVQICQSLVYLHTSEPPLAHLDVKPANVLVSSLTVLCIVVSYKLILGGHSHTSHNFDCLWLGQDDESDNFHWNKNNVSRLTWIPIP